MSAKYEFIAGEEGNSPVSKMCPWAKVSRSGYHIAAPDPARALAYDGTRDAPMSGAIGIMRRPVLDALSTAS